MKLTLRDQVTIPIFTGVVAVLGLLPAIPLAFVPAPITAQTLGVMLAGIVLGAWRGALSMVLFIALVAVGAPVAAGGAGGAHILVGPTAGYLWSWPVAAWLIGYLTERTARLTVPKLLVYNLLGGVGVVYAIGVPVMSWVTKLPMETAWIGSLVFVPGDVMKAGIAAVLGLAIRRALA